jgi:hypothetical protein
LTGTAPAGFQSYNFTPIIPWENYLQRFQPRSGKNFTSISTHLQTVLICAPNDIDAILSLDDGTVCAVMIELVQGEGGVHP